MSVYTVQAPASLLGEPAFERAAFLREGFSWAAFFFAFFWLIWHRLWATAALWFVVCSALAWLSFSSLSFGVFPLITLALHILLGLEANGLRRCKYARQDYRLVGVVTANSLESAERTFFARAVPDRIEPRPASNTGKRASFSSTGSAEVPAV